LSTGVAPCALVYGPVSRSLERWHGFLGDVRSIIPAVETFCKNRELAVAES
jgi:hypothetical protein